MRIRSHNLWFAKLANNLSVSACSVFPLASITLLKLGCFHVILTQIMDVVKETGNIGITGVGMKGEHLLGSAGPVGPDGGLVLRGKV